MPEFRPGDVVECVDASGALSLKRGECYTIVDVSSSGEAVLVGNDWHYFGCFRKVADSEPQTTKPTGVASSAPVILGAAYLISVGGGFIRGVLIAADSRKNRGRLKCDFLGRLWSTDVKLSKLKLVDEKGGM